MLITQDDADFHTIVADMADIPRVQAKTINLGLFYGMGKNKLQAELGVNKEKAEEIIYPVSYTSSIRKTTYGCGHETCTR